MKKLLLPALLVALAAAALDAAGPPGAAGKKAPAGGATLDEVKRLVADVDDTQDVLYVGQPYPVLLRLHLRVNNKSTFARWDEFIETFHKFLDRNKSGSLDRSEASRAPQAAQMSSYYVGNPFTFTGRRTPAMVGAPFADMDADRDGKVTLDELKGYYLKNNAGPILLQAQQAAPTPPGVPQTASSDPLFELLDTNKDGKLSKAELGAALKALTKYDVNDDELISQAELNMGVRGSAFDRLRAAEEALAAQVRGRQPPRPQGPTNLMLVPREEGKRVSEKLNVARELIKVYDKDKDGKLTAEEMGLPKEKFAAVTRKKDGKATALDLAKWLAGKPAAEFTVKVDGGAAMMRRPGGIQRVQPRPNADDMSVALEGVRIKVVSYGAGARYGYKQYLTNLFKQIDDESKGYITRKQLDDDQQFAFMRGLFDFADRNADNRLTEAELKALLDVMEAGQGAQLSLALAPSGQGLFQALDSNADGNLSVRELRSSWTRLGALDKDGDGAINRLEFPQQFMLSVTQGPNYGFVPPDAYTDPNAGSRAAGPVWFRKMDRNGDGDVSRLEWLGTKEDFDKVDADKDDLISQEEAEAFDAKLRKS